MISENQRNASETVEGGSKNLSGSSDFGIKTKRLGRIK